MNFKEFLITFVPFVFVILIFLFQRYLAKNHVYRCSNCKKIFSISELPYFYGEKTTYCIGLSTDCPNCGKFSKFETIRADEIKK